MRIVALLWGVLPTRGTRNGTRLAKTSGVTPCVRAAAEDVGVRHGPGAFAGVGAGLRFDWMRQYDLHEWRQFHATACCIRAERGGRAKYSAGGGHGSGHKHDG